MGRVDGKVAIITGAASGFGAATARLLARVVADTQTLHGGVHVLMHNAGVYGSGAAQDIAYAVLFLTSDESRHITASEIVIDGGLTGAG